MNRGLAERNIEKFYWYWYPDETLVLSYYGLTGSFYIPRETFTSPKELSDEDLYKALHEVLYSGDEPGLHPNKVRFLGFDRETITPDSLLKAWQDGLYVYREFCLYDKQTTFFYDPGKVEREKKRLEKIDDVFSQAWKKLDKLDPEPRPRSRAFGFFVRFKT